MGTEGGTETAEKGNLIVETVMGRGPISLVPVDVRTVHTHGTSINAGTVHIHGSHVNIRTTHDHGSI